MQIATDTATLVVFDPELLAHRVGEPPDWWVSEELAEVNAGNLFAVSLAGDGVYEVEVNRGPARQQAYAAMEARLRCSSGMLLLGPGEALPGGDLPADSESSHRLNVAPGVYLIRCAWTVNDTLELSIVPSDSGDATNELDRALRFLPETFPRPPEPKPAETEPEKEAERHADGFVKCPFCRRSFSTRDPNRWVDGRHETCGQRIRLK